MKHSNRFLMFGVSARNALTGFVMVVLFTMTLAVFLMPASSHAATYYVDASQPDDLEAGTTWGTAKKTIVAAIGVSDDGDVILVKYGAYPITADIELNNTNRMIGSDDGTHTTWETATPDSNQCTIIASGCRIFTITGASITNATRIRGFKITAGNATGETTGGHYGGGIYIAGGADPIIENCWITNNTSDTGDNGYGGGIACMNDGTDPTVQYCNITNNTASTNHHGHGGGISCDDGSAPNINNNSISSNIGATNRTGSGGGIYCTNSNADIWSNTITNNRASTSSAAGGNGGGIYIFAGDVEVWSNTITDNIAATGATRQGLGGGIYCYFNADIRDNEISSNTASTNGQGKGGGICCDGAAEIWDNEITHNTASSSNHSTEEWRRGYGGGIFDAGNDQNIRYNIISDNTASVHGPGQGGGIRFDSGGTMERNIIANNTASSNSVGYGGGAYAYNAGWSDLNNNTFFQNANTEAVAGSGHGSGFYYASGSVPDVNSNIFSSHNIANSDGTAIYSEIAMDVYHCLFWDNTIHFNDNVTSHTIYADPRFTDPGTGDFTLQYDSPCIDAGDPLFTVPTDGGWRADIGADEYTGTRVKRSVSATGELLFGGQTKAKINVTTLGSLSEIDITVHPGETHSGAPTSVERWYEITPTGSGATFDITLSYADSELHGETESALKLWRWTGSSWYGPKPSSSSSTAENWLTVAGETAFSDWVISDAETEGALPVELSTFTATPSDDKVTLHWRTESETNNLGFNVYRSDRKDDNFSKINGKLIKGHGTSATPHTYSFTDETAKTGQTYYYYIEDTDYSGEVNKSNILKVTVGQEKKVDLLPKETVLMQNYPNPFNPETWIPFQLSTDADVVISIYDIHGQLVRKIALGKIPADVYISKDRAVHWDGRNDGGEKVSSGLYFYQLQAGEYRATKRMLILK